MAPLQYVGNIILICYVKSANVLLTMEAKSVGDTFNCSPRCPALT